MGSPGSQEPAMDGFLGRVAEIAGLSSQQEADRLARVTVSTLSERLSAGQVNDFSPVLPAGLREELARHGGQAVTFDKVNFLDRISGQIDTVDPDEVERQVRAVLAVLHEWIPDEEIEDTVGQLPPALAEMFRSP